MRKPAVILQSKALFLWSALVLATLIPLLMGGSQPTTAKPLTDTFTLSPCVKESDDSDCEGYTANVDSGHVIVGDGTIRYFTDITVTYEADYFTPDPSWTRCSDYNRIDREETLDNTTFGLTNSGDSGVCTDSGAVASGHLTQTLVIDYAGFNGATGVGVRYIYLTMPGGFGAHVVYTNISVVLDGTLGTGGIITPTPTPTPTITPPPPPPPGGGVICRLLGFRTSVFGDLTSAGDLWELDPEGIMSNPPEEPKGLSILQGYARLPMTLDPGSKYKVTVTYHTYHPEIEDVFQVKLGKETLNVHIDSVYSIQQATTPIMNFAPNHAPDQYVLEIKKLESDPDPGLVVDFVCVELIDEDGSGNPGGVVVGTCKNCIYIAQGGLEHLGEDIINLIGWLWCGLSQLFSCVLANFLARVWQTIQDVLSVLSFARLWFGIVVTKAIEWILSNLSILIAWLRGSGGNIAILLYSLAIDILNRLNLLHIVNEVLQWLASLPGLINAGLILVGSVFNAIGGLVGAVLAWIGAGLNLITGILGIIPEGIAAIATGFNADPQSPPVWALTCTDSNTLFYYPCLGLYIADNTVFDGPVAILIPIIMAVVAINTWLWAQHQIREAIEKS